MSAAPLPLAIAWLTPLTGIVVASVLVPLLVSLYFLKLRRRAAGVPTTLLWKRSTEDMRANTPFQRLRPSLLLFLQLLLLGFVAFALMQPRMDLGLSGGGRTVIIVDASASMGATDLAKGKTRLDVAKEQAAERIDHRASVEQMIATGRDIEAQVLARAVGWIAERRVLLNGARTVVFR